MADLIKKIKIKKQDGTFTDYIPIGAEANNVSTEDGLSVENKLNKKPYYFDTVADMKAATYLKNGDMAITLGYYSANDGGNAKYYITNDSNLIIDNILILSLENNLKAKIIPEFNSSINVRSAGGKSGDATFRNNANIINTIINAGYNCYIPRGNFYIIETISINLRNGGSLYGSSTASKIFKSDRIDEFTGDCLVEVYDAGGNYFSETYRGKDAIHDIGFNGITAGGITGLKIGGDTGDTKEGAISYTQYKNIHFYRCGIALLIQDHSYKINFYNVWWDECPGGLRTKQGISDAGEVINFFGCGLFTGGIYTEQGMQFFGCTIHLANMNYGGMPEGLTSTIYVKSHLVNFTNCHFERIGNGTYQNFIYCKGGKVNLFGPEAVVSRSDKIYFSDSVFHTELTSASDGNESIIRVIGGDFKYFLGRIRALDGYEDSFSMCKGNVDLELSTKGHYSNTSVIPYKAYDYTTDWLSTFGNNNLMVGNFIKTGIFAKEETTITKEDNILTINTTGSSSNGFGLYKVYPVKGHKSVIIHADLESNNTNIKFAYNTTNSDAVSIFRFLDKDGNILNTGTNGNAGAWQSNAHLIIPDTSKSTINWFALPEGCEYIAYGIGGFGAQWLNTFTITVNEMYCELL